MQPMTKAALTFTGLLILGQVLYGVLSYFVDIQSSAIGLVLVMAAAMGAGQGFASGEKRGMTRGERAKFAVVATLIASAIAVVGLYAVFAWYGLPLSVDVLLMSMGVGAAELADMRGFLWIGVMIATVATVLISYFACSWGSSSALKQLKKRGNI